MRPVQPIIILVFTALAVFGQAAFPGLFHWLHTQVDLLPALMVYAALRAGPALLGGLAVWGGLCFDSLSANPFGVTILPLAVVGFAVYSRRDLILRDQPYAQFVLGAAASAVAPVLTVLLLLTGGEQPMVGWGSLWQWLVMTLAGGAATPALFYIFDWSDNAFGYKRMPETAFRPDREIRRGRS